MFARRISTALLCLSIACVSACTKSQPPVANASSANASSTPQQSQPATTNAAAPRTEAAQVAPPASAVELQEVVARIYKNAVTIDTSRKDAFIVGDFNGDNSQDIAVAVKPGKGMLSELNDEYANWILGDPHSVLIIEAQNGVKKFPEKPAPIVVRQSDNLLAVIHGYQETGWRSPKATQTYLLRNVGGSGMEAKRARALIDETAAKEQLPPLGGDVIQETLSGTPGFIYWTGAKYAWHSTAATN